MDACGRWCEKVLVVLKGGGVVESCDNDCVEECGVVSSSEDEFVRERDRQRDSLVELNNFKSIP